jgi:hypothetical protein
MRAAKDIKDELTLLAKNNQRSLAAELRYAAEQHIKAEKAKSKKRRVA